MYRVDISSKGASGFIVRSNGNELNIDIKGTAISPPSVLLASVGSCMGVYIRKYAQGAGLDLKDFDIKVEADFVKEPQVHFKDINVSIDLKGLDLDERRKKALLGFIKNCPVHNTLKSNPDINIKIG
ncbi:MAG: OsmC family protein [Candidatus Omnitrophota bacterium]